MPSRFEFERAIKRSDLPPLARLIALVIASWADADTGSIAHKNQPAQSVLLEATGMSKGSFLTHRKTLLDAGWVKCDSPDRVKAQTEHAQNVYSIHIPGGKAGSGADLAKTDKRPGKRREPRSGADLALGQEPTQPKRAKGTKSGSNLGQELTTRVFPSSVSPLLPPDEGGQGGSNNQDRTPDAFAYIQPLIRAMTDAGFNAISWQMQTDDLHAVARVLNRAGVDAMVESAINAKRTSRTPIRFAAYFLKSGWGGLAPKSTKPPATEKPPWCGDPDCDEITRTRDVETDTGHFLSAPCPHCHPNRKKTAA